MLDTCVFQLPEGSLFLGDIDGDKVQEILIHSNTGGVRGNIWRTWVLKVEDGEVYILFENLREFDTGFESQFLADYQMKITNCFTGYSLVFDVKDDHKKAYKSAEEPPTYSLVLNSFLSSDPRMWIMTASARSFANSILLISIRQTTQAPRTAC